MQLFSLFTAGISNLGLQTSGQPTAPNPANLPVAAYAAPQNLPVIGAPM